MESGWLAGWLACWLISLAKSTRTRLPLLIQGKECDEWGEDLLNDDA